MRSRLLGRGNSRSLFVTAREEPENFGAVYLAYRDQVLRFLVRQTLDPEVAFDLMAETFADLFARLPDFRGDTEEQGRAWMWAITRAQLAGWRRRGAVERRNLERIGIPVPSLGPQEYERIEELADLDRLRPLLQGALAQLTDDQRYILEQRVVAHREYDDLAREAGTSAVAIRNRVSRALRQLSAVLAEGGAIDERHDAPWEHLLT
jgi:RNA polymerase sigma factor (sigma-70 family)